MSEWKVFQLNECDWIVARTMGEAQEELLANYSETIDDNAHELTDEEMDVLTIRDCDENERPTGEILTFRESLARMVADGLKAPTLFCSTE